jgi:hypothetical protein
MTRGARRALVLAALLVCGFLVSGFPRSLHGAGMAPVLVLAVLGVVLIRATGGLAFARARTLDERQTQLRDVAYRRAFRLLGLAMVIVLVLAFLGDYLPFVLAPRSQVAPGWFPPQVDSGIGGRFLVAVLGLLVMMPTFVIAWMETDRPRGDPADGDRTVTARRRLPSTSVVLLAIAVASWVLGVARAPSQTAAASRNFSVDSERPGSVCRHFATGRIIGAEFGATVGMRVEVCWNGRQAFVVGDPRIPPPDPAQNDPRGEPMLTACGADNTEDFAVVSGTTCTAKTDRDGTLHYDVRARVSALPLSIGARVVDMSLVVTRNGRILAQP